MGRWAGKTVAVIGAGPSLTKQDCDLIHRAGLPTIAVNSSWRLVPFADVLYAGDLGWWENYGQDVTIDAQRWTCTRQAAHKFGLNMHHASGSYNSGMRAIQFAIEQGAARVILLGFDCSVKNGLHWHGAHGRTQNPDAAKVRKWRRHFHLVALLAKARRCEIINCSRYTELTCFPVRDLESSIGSCDCDVALAG